MNQSTNDIRPEFVAASASTSCSGSTLSLSFASPKSSNFTNAIAPEHDVFRLDVAVNYSFCVRCFSVNVG